jgi:hypothetical protein
VDTDRRVLVVGRRLVAVAAHRTQAVDRKASTLRTMSLVAATT